MLEGLENNKKIACWYYFLYKTQFLIIDSYL